MEYGVMAAAEMDAVARILALAFASEPAGVREWVENAGIEHMRVMREGERVIGTLLRIPMGQYFGGRAVSLVGVAGVGVAPEARGAGVARRMMAEAVNEIRDGGVALSGLYCSTQALYRQSGYEMAGSRFMTTIPIARISGMPKARRVVVLGQEHEAEVRAVYADWARRFDGALERGEYIWKRVRAWRGQQYQGFGVTDEAGRLRGYFYMSQTRDMTSGRQDITLSDVAFRDAEAGRQLLGLLADFEPMGDKVTLAGGAMHPLVGLLPQQRYTVTFRDYWMIRVADVKRALEARGYPLGVDVEVVLKVSDEVIAVNHGAWRLRVKGGVGTVERCGEGDVKEDGAVTLHVRGLAALYSGWMSPIQAEVLGWCAGSERALRVLGGVFANGGPWMADFY